MAHSTLPYAMQPKFTIVNEDCSRFVYMDVGTVKCSDLPRLSSTFEARELAEKFLNTIPKRIQREIDRYEASITGWRSNTVSCQETIDQSISNYRARIQFLEEQLASAPKFKVVLFQPVLV